MLLRQNIANLFLKACGKCLAFIGRKGEKFICEHQIGKLETPIEVHRNFKQRRVKALIRVLVDRCSERKVGQNWKVNSCMKSEHCVIVSFPLLCTCEIL